MGFISKSNGLFFYVMGLTLLFITYAFIEPVLKNSSSNAANAVKYGFALVKVFYVFGGVFIILGIFIFALSSLYPEKKRHYM